MVLPMQALAWHCLIRPTFNQLFTLIKKQSSLTSKPANIYYHLGDAYYELSQLEDAIDNYKIALVLDPQMIYAYINMTRILCQRSRLSEAMELITQALKLVPECADVYIAFSYVLDGQNNRTGAIIALKIAKNLSIIYTDIYKSLGIDLFEQGRSEEASRKLKIQH